MSRPNNFTYSEATDAAGLRASVSVFSERSGLRKEVATDMEEAGFRLLFSNDLAGLLDCKDGTLGDIVYVDVPSVDAEGLAVLSEIDMCLAVSGAQLIVSTSMEALDDVFSCLDQSAPQILVNPTRADRILAVGRVMNSATASRVNELSQEDRLALLRLSEQVDLIAKRLEGLEERGPRSLSEHKTVFKGFEGSNPGDRLVGSSLPDPRFVRDIIRRRHARLKYFDADLFADPAWDMLLDLTAAAAEHRRVSVTSLCIASGVPTTTALRWIRQMTSSGLLIRLRDDLDKRRAFITLSDSARNSMAEYFASISDPAQAYAA